MSARDKDKKPGLMSSPKSSFWAKKKPLEDGNPDSPTKTKIQTISEQTADGKTAAQMNAKPGQTKKQKAFGHLKKGGRMVSNAGDFISRLAALLVMIVTTINTSVITVTSFIEGNYWVGGIHAFLLVFIHLPVIIVMIWLMCKARVKSIYRKVRPGQTQQDAVIEEVSTSSSSDEEEGKEKKKKKKEKEKKDDKNKDAKVIKNSKDDERMADVMKRANRGQHYNQAFNMA